MREVTNESCLEEKKHKGNMFVFSASYFFEIEMLQ